MTAHLRVHPEAEDERAGEVIIVAFAHHSRRPGYWKQRIDG